MLMKFSAPIKCLSGSTLLVLCSLLAGCGLGGSVGSSAGSAAGLPSTGSPSSGSPSGGSPSGAKALSGHVHGGQNPVLNGTIQLYQVGTTGYTSQAVPLLTTTVTTDSGGAFNITGDYTCTSGSYLYITSSGGSPQVSSNPATNNNNITLAAALGLCDNLSASTFITIDEVTTVAAAYALAQFSQGTTFGTTLLSKPGSGSSAPADNFSTSSTNVAGLGNAMAISQILANTSTGTSPGSNTASSIAGVTGVTIATPGSGYTSIPTVSFSAPATGVTATGLVGMSIGGVTLTNSPAQVYTSVPTLSFDTPDESTGSGTRAAATVTCNLTGFDLTTAGAGYTSAPTVTFTGGGATTQAQATATINGSGAVSGVTITTPGVGYTSPPTVTFTGGGFTTTAVGLGEYNVTGVTITTPGSNYTSMPIVTFTNSNIGSIPQTGVATPGGVTTVNVTSGSGYTSVPTVTFSAPTSGTTAAGTAIIGSVSDGNTATPEWWQVNLIADILAACVNSTGGVSGDGSACGTLFANVLNGGTAPADTFQAALDLALYPAVPSAKITNLYNLIPALGVPFQPYPSTATAVTDFSIGIEYQPMAGSTTLLKQPSAIAFDSLGNAWVANQPTATAPSQGFLVELTPTGVPIQAGTAAGDYSSNFAINSYSLSGGYTALGGQYVEHNGSAQLNGLFVPAIDTSNNLWVSDRENSVMVNITGSGTNYSNSLTYQNGGNALDSGGNGATGVNLPAHSGPEQTYIDGSNNVWFVMTGVAVPASASTGVTCTALSLSGAVNLGLGVFINESTTNAKAGALYGNNPNTPAPFIAVDPNLSDYTTTGSVQTPIPGAPFVWSIGGSADTLLGMNFSQPGGTNYQACDPSTNPTVEPNTLGGYGSGANVLPPAVTNPYIGSDSIAGDTVYSLAPTINDITFDKFGNLWVANQGLIDTTSTSASQIKSSISKITPNYGSTFSAAAAQTNFTFSVFHQVASLYDGYTGSYPQYLTSDGSGNIWFAMSSTGSKYVNAISNTGAAISPYTVETPGTGSTTGGFVGSACNNCSLNGGAPGNYARPNTWALGRPAVDLSGNVWIPVNGETSSSSYSTYVDMLVGIAAPKVNPDSLGLKNGTFASKP